MWGPVSLQRTEARSPAAVSGKDPADRTRESGENRAYKELSEKNVVWHTEVSDTTVLYEKTSEISYLNHNHTTPFSSKCVHAILGE